MSVADERRVEVQEGDGDAAEDQDQSLKVPTSDRLSIIKWILTPPFDVFQCRKFSCRSSTDIALGYASQDSRHVLLLQWLGL